MKLKMHMYIHGSFKKKICAIILFLIVLTIGIGLITKFNNKLGKTEEVEQTTLSSKVINAEVRDASELGQIAKVTASQLTQRKTGTGPFDADNNPGNDSSDSNEVVRSFDQVTWTIENTLGLKNGSTQEFYKGGVIEVTATLPGSCANLMKWDLNAMAWAENASVSPDGTQFSASYTMPTNDITVPGKQTLVLVLQVSGAPNGLLIQPTFSVNLKGNSNDEKIKINGTNSIYKNDVRTSAVPKLDLEIHDYGEGIVTQVGGKNIRVYRYSFAFRLLGDTISKGMKGIEMPTGDLNFNIKYNMQRTPLGQQEYTDISNNLSLYNYKLSNSSLTPLGDSNNTLDEFPSYYWTHTGLYPLSANGNKRNTVYKNGNLTMSDNKNGTISVRISNYGIDPYSFPDRIDSGSYSDDLQYSYEKNVGYISVGIFYMSVDLNDQTQMQNTQCYLNLDIENINVKTSSGSTCTQETENNNNKATTNHVTYGPGSYSKDIHLYNEQGVYLASPWGQGNSKISIGSKVNVLTRVINSSMNEISDYMHGLDILLKFDDITVEPSTFSDGKEFTSRGNYGNTDMTFNVLYAGKNNKAGWSSDEEMIQTTMEQLVYFDTLEALKNSGYTCVAVMYESTGGVVKSGIEMVINQMFYVKTTAPIGRVSQFVSDVRVYNQGHAPDRSRQSHLLTSDKNAFPEVRASMEHFRYVKTQYDEGGQMIQGTHYGGVVWGNSLLILGADQSISIVPLDDNGNIKTNYDIGKQENKVNYRITPQLTSKNNIRITNVNIKIDCTLPYGVLFMSGTCNYGDPASTVKNADGTTTLTWYINNCTVGEAIEPIQFTAQIDETTENGHQYNAKAVISEVKQGGVSKLGTSDVIYRTSTATIQIINLASYSLFKNTDTPIIEVNGDINFTLSAINKTEIDVTEFQLLDVLPYNGDNRGTSYHGTYSVKSIGFKKTKDNGQTTVDSGNLKLYITTSPNVRNGVTAKNTDLGNAPMWEEVTPGTTINRQITGIAIVGRLEAKTKLETIMQFTTNGNRPEDIYRNKVTGQTNRLTNEIESTVTEITVIKRELDGVAWYDRNEDGLITTGENKVQGLEISLINADGTPAKSINGTNIPSTTTDANGYYKFEDMVRGDYKVVVQVAGKPYVITQKNVGTNEAINSKFNADGTTDTITKLNSISNPLIEQNNENVGLKYPQAVIKINKKDSVTKEPLDQAVFGYYEWNGTEYVRKGAMTDNKDGTYATPLLEWNLITNQGKFRIVEEEAPQYYTNSRKTIDIVLNEPGYHEYTYEVENEPNKVMIKTIKIDEETKNKIKGATFTVYEWDVATNNYKEYQRNGKTMTLTFQEDDRTYLSEWLYSNRTNQGKFRIVETLAPDGYFGNWSDGTKTSKVNNDIVITLDNNGQTLTISNETGGRYNNKRVKGTISVSKIDKETNRYLAQGDATLDGAVYGLYAAETIIHKDTVTGKLYDPDQLVDSQTIINGKLTFNNVEIGRYYIKEITPPKGYTPDNTKYEINMNYEGEGVEHLQRETTVVEQVIKQAFSLQKLSENSEETETLPLEGAGFKIFLIKDLAGVKNGTIKPDSNGNYRAMDFFGYDFSQEQTAIDYSESQEGKRIPELFTDRLGGIVSPEIAYGQYVVVETTVPEDRYVVNPIIVKIEKDSRIEQNYRYLLDREFEALIKVNKIDSKTGENVIKKNAAYRIWSITEEKYIEQIVKYPKAETFGTEKNPYRVGEDGYFITPLKLKIGEYELREVEAPEGYILQGHEGKVENENITSTPKEIVKFKVSSNTAYYQDEDTEELVISINQNNDPMVGEVKIIKQGEYLVGIEEKEDGRKEFKYELKPISEAEFKVYAKEDIVSQDNQGTVLYEKDALVGTVSTNTQGEGYLDNLPIGKYYVKETQAGYGFVLNEEEKEFEIKYQDELTPTQIVTVNYINERQKIKLNGEGGILVEKFADKKVYKPGEEANYTIKVSNTSEQDITDIIVTETKINGEFEDIQTDNISKISDKTVEIKCLKPGETVTLRFKTVLGELEDTDEEKVINVVKATGTTEIPDPEDPNKKIKVEVEDEDDETVYVTDKKLVVVKEALKKQYEPGEVAQYVIHVINNGTVDLVNVKVEETLIDGHFVDLEGSSKNGVKVVFAQTEEGEEDTNSVIIDKINPGEEVILRYEYNVPKDIEIVEGADDILIPNIVKGKGKAVIPKAPTQPDEPVDPENPSNPDNPDKPDKPINPDNPEDPNYTYEDVEDEDDEEIKVKEDDINLGIIKQDSRTGERVEGAIFGLYANENIKSSNGEVVVEKDTLIEKSTTNSQGKAIFKADLPLGKYYIKEIEAPKGYYLSNEKVEFDATYRGQYVEYILESHIISNKSIDAKIEKKDEEGNLLTGATLEITDETGKVIETWITGEQVNIFEKLEKGKVYTLRETNPAKGYTTAEKMKFFVGEDEKLYQRIEDDEGFLIENVEIDFIEIVDEKTKMEIEVVDKETKEHLTGITVDIVDKETGEVVYTLVTSEEVDVVEGLPVGKYDVVTRDTENRGYVTSYGEIDVRDSKIYQKFVLEQDYTKVEVSLKDEETRELLPGGTIEIIDEERNVVREINTEEVADYFERLPVGKYRLHQTKVPAGYWGAEDIEIEIKDIPEKQVFEMLNRRKTFNMSIEKKLIKQVYNGTETNIGGNLSKFEIRPQNIGKAEFWTIYTITVRNTGEIEGKATVKELVPDGFEMYQESNLAWKVDGKEATLTTDIIEPGKSVEYEVALRWKQSALNIGNKENKVLITSTDNEVGFKDENEKDNNASANILIALSTGLDVYLENATYIMLAVAILGIISIIIIKTHSNRKEN